MSLWKAESLPPALARLKRTPDWLESEKIHDKIPKTDKNKHFPSKSIFDLLSYFQFKTDLFFVLSKITDYWNFHKEKTGGTQVFHHLGQAIKIIRLTRTIQFIRPIKTVSFSVANLLFHDTVPVATGHCAILSLPVRIIVLNQTVVIAVTVELVVPIVILMFFK